MVDYYYGVDKTESGPDRPQYSGRAVINPFVGFTGAIKLSERIFFEANFEYIHLDAGISDSPIVDDNYSFETSLTLNYLFF